MIKSRVLRTGDGSHPYAKVAAKDAEAAQTETNNNEVDRDTEHFWGFGKNFIIFHGKFLINFLNR